MGFLSSTPDIPPPVTYAAPKSPSNAGTAAADDEAARRRAASGYQGTILTGASGSTAATTAGKTLLGM